MNPKSMKKEREKGRKKSREIARYYFKNNKVVAEKSESKIVKMSEG